VQRTAAIAAALRASEAATADVLAGGIVPPPSDLPPEPPGMEGVVPELLLGGGMGALPAGAPPVAGGMPAPAAPTAPAPTPTMPIPGVQSPVRPFQAGGVVSEDPPIEKRPYSLTRGALQSMLPPGVRPVGNIIPAVTLFHLLREGLARQREGKPLPEYAAGGVVDDDTGKPLRDFGMETLVSAAGLDDEETMLWDGANSGPPGPEAFEDYLLDPEGGLAEQDGSFVRDMADLLDEHPAMATAIWNITVSMYDKAPDELSETAKTLVSEWRGSRPKADTAETAETAETPEDVPPPPDEAY
jgi:hypothetical protein